MIADAPRLLDASGRLLCRSPGGGFATIPFAQAAGSGLVPVDLPREAMVAGAARFLRFLSGEDAPPLAIAQGPLAGWTLRPGHRRGTVALLRETAWLATDRQGCVVERVVDAPGDAESFLVFGPADLRLLRGILENRWVLRSTGTAVEPGSVAFHFPFNLEVGGTRYDLRHHLPFEGAALPYRLSLFRAGWRYDELCLLRPLVQLRCFGPDDAARLPGLVAALRGPGVYQGHVLVVTDQARDAVLASLAGINAGEMLVSTVADDSDPATRALARYGVLEGPAMLAFQPVLMLDTHVLVERPLAELLAELAVADRLAVPLEPAARRRLAPFSGLNLLQVEGHDLRDLLGVDPSIVGLPNAASTSASVGLIRRILANRARAVGNAPTVPWIESEVVNYVCYACTRFDTHLFERFVGAPGQGAVLTRFPTDGDGRDARDATLRAHRLGETSLLRRLHTDDDDGEEPVGPP